MKSNRWEIVFEDDDFIVIDKPANYLTIPDRYNTDIPNLHDDLKKYRGDIFINHRLDKDTTGLILFTKNEKAHHLMSYVFEQRLIDKRYHAIVQGKPIEEVGQIDLNLAISNTKKKRMIIDAAGKKAVTIYKIISSWEQYSLLELKLITGRMHQIRVHLQAINCPILCDSYYGDGESFYLSKIKRKFRKNKEQEERPLISRQALHASRLIFINPISEKEMDFSSEMPKDMRACVNQFEKLLTKV